MEFAELSQRLGDIATEQAKMAEQIRGALRRIDEQKQLAESVHALALSVRDLANGQKNLDGNVVSLRADVDEIKAKPARRWDSAVSAIVAALVTGVVAFFIGRMGGA